MATTSNQRRLAIRFATPDDRSAIARFNERLRAAGRREQFPLDPALPGESHRVSGVPGVFRRLMVADDGEEIRAGLLLIHHTLWVHGEKRSFCWIQLPLSEGVIDRRYAMAMLQVVRNALAYQPHLMELGVGSLDEEWSQFLIKMGWRQHAVPFLFCPVRATRVLRGLAYLQRRPVLGRAAVAAATLGGGLALNAHLALRRLLTGRTARYATREEPEFGPWADDIFQAARDDYGALAQRDATVLNVLYPADDPRFTRLRVQDATGRRELGWMVVIHTQMQGNPYFGDLRVGTLVDGLGRVADIPALMAAGTRHLRQLGVDLIVANWSHAAWVSASHKSGFLRGPTNFFFFTSPAGSPLLEPTCRLDQIHLTRGDCDGPEHLLGETSPDRRP